MRKVMHWFILAAVLLLLLPSLGLAGAALHENLPDQARALTLKEVSLKTGVTLQYAEKGNPNGIPLIFIHGYTDSWKSFSETLPAISPKYRSLAITLRGFGDSFKPESGYSGSDFAADIAAFMDTLQIEKAVIVGHSMGSFIAQHVALNYPGRVLGVVLIGSAARPNNPVVQDLAAYVATPHVELPAAFVADLEAFVDALAEK
jgi:pimeloyl-ACP methyl ester carboxylesterase